VNGGTALLITRFGDLCRELGMTPHQALEAFCALPYGSRQAAWDDLARYTVSTRGSV
jgi:hypothetical protein